MTNSHNNYYPMVIILLPMAIIYYLWSTYYYLWSSYCTYMYIMVNILLPMVIILLPTCMVIILLPIWSHIIVYGRRCLLLLEGGGYHINKYGRCVDKFFSRIEFFFADVREAIWSCKPEFL